MFSAYPVHTSSDDELRRLRGRVVEVERRCDMLVVALKALVQASQDGASGEYIRGVIRALDIHDLLIQREEPGNGGRS